MCVYKIVILVYNNHFCNQNSTCSESSGVKLFLRAEMGKILTVLISVAPKMRHEMG